MRKPLTRHTRLARGERKPSETLRIYGPPEYENWLHEQPCVVSGQRGVECVHVRGGGVGRKADYKWTVPMIAAKHAELHLIGIRSFEAKYNIDLELAAIACNQAWLAHLAR